MPGIGTIVNVIAVLVAGLLGLGFGHLISKRFHQSLLQACGLSVIVLGLGSTFAGMLTESQGSYTLEGVMMMIVSLTLGCVIGEALNIENRLEEFGHWLQTKSGNQKDSSFINGFMTASLTICVGAMAIVGSIQDGILHQPDTLFAKSILDFIVIVIMSASMGKGCMFAAIPVGLLQGGVTLCSHFLEPFLTESALLCLDIVGNILIAGVGINLIFGKTIKVANLLPALIIAVFWGNVLM